MCGSYVSGQLTAKLRKLFQAEEGITGQRPLYVSKNHSLLKGFSLNKKNALQNVLKAKFLMKPKPENNQFIFHFPSFVSEESIIYPGQATHFRIFFHLVTISDFIFDESVGTYRCLNSSVHGVSDSSQSQLKPICKIPLEPMTQKVEILNPDLDLSSDLAMLVLLGIRFYEFRNSHYHPLGEGSSLDIFHTSGA
jgi:hypothetical protein